MRSSPTRTSNSSSPCWRHAMRTALRMSVLQKACACCLARADFKSANPNWSGRLSPAQNYSFSPTGFASYMDNLSVYAHRPLAFVLRYLRKRPASHAVILAAVVAAVACSVGTQYAVKNLVDGLASGPTHSSGVWLAFALVISFIAADNFLWRIATWTASFTFVGVSGGR